MISIAEYQKRRERLARQLDGAVGLVFAGDAHGDDSFKPERHFAYLTGLTDEPGAIILFDPTHLNPKRRIVLFLRAIDPEADRWVGYRETICQSLRDRLGFETVFRASRLPACLTDALRCAKRAACLHPFSVYPAAVSPDLAAFQQVAQRVPGISITDQTQLLDQLRAIKSAVEIDLMQRAADITTMAFNQIATRIRPGVREAQIQLALETAYRHEGGDIAYGTIVGSGLNSTILHYEANRGVLEAGDLLLIDSGASFAGYASDVTRTFPVSGKFSPEQRDLYELVLKAELAAIKAARPGAYLHDIDHAARSIIDKAGLGDAFIHSTGHPLGLHVHDVQPDHPLKPNMVITVEPGIYLPEKKIGIRIEDDILITSKGNRVMTPAIPKTVKEIEAAMLQ